MTRMSRTLLAVVTTAGFWGLIMAEGRAVAATAPNPLMLYSGSWRVTPAGGAKPYRLVNDCSEVGRYFACQQTANGSVVGLLVVIPTSTSGHYYTQTLLPEGRATGRDELEISGNQWTFKSSRLDGGKTTYFRTTNTFSGKNHIHFERAESTDGKQWSIKYTGDQTREEAGKAR
jgi:hypothetical protein